MAKENSDRENSKIMPGSTGAVSQDSLTPLQRYLAKQSPQNGVDKNSARASDSQASQNSNSNLNAKRVADAAAPLLEFFLIQARRFTKQLSSAPQSASATPAAAVAIGARVPADVGGRFGALLVDMLILYILKNVLLVTILPDLSFELNFLAFYLVAFPYYAWSYHARGTSLGKLVMGCQVIDVVSGRRIGIWRAFFRETLGKWISFICFGIGFVMAAFRSDRMALHDLIFETQVIRQETANQSR